MRHPTEGVLRRLLDEPAGVADADRRHVADCVQCLRDVVAVREDAALVGAALSLAGAVDVDVAAAWRRLSTAGPGPGAGPARASRPRARSAGLLRRPAAAAVAVGLVLTGASAAAANDWLQVFRTEQVAPLSIRTGDLVALPDLSAYGELEVTAQPDVHQVADAAAAAAETGLDVPEVAELPSGVSGEPVHQVGGQASATFTFSAERAARAAGQALPPPPPGLDGTSVRLVAGPGVVQVWESSTGAPALLVGRVVAPSAFSSGVPFGVLRDYLLSLPGLPRGQAEQLRAFGTDGGTLPLPLPADEVDTRSATVDGTPATVVTTRDRTLAGVVWVQDGTLNVVAGSLDDDEVLAVAQDLR